MNFLSQNNTEDNVQIAYHLTKINREKMKNTTTAHQLGKTGKKNEIDNKFIYLSVAGPHNEA